MDNMVADDEVSNMPINVDTIIPATRRSRRVMTTLACHRDYDTTTKRRQTPSSLTNFISYQNISPKYKACLSKFLAIYEPKSYEGALKDDRWTDAMHQELQALEENGTWILVP